MNNEVYNKLKTKKYRHENTRPFGCVMNELRLAIKQSIKNTLKEDEDNES